MSEGLIVLTSQPVNGDDGFQLHGLFRSFRSAASHVAKDAALEIDQKENLINEWGRLGVAQGSVETESMGNRDLWVATKCQVREHME